MTALATRSAISRRSVRLLAIVVLSGATFLSLASASVARDKLCRSCIHNVGLDTFYTHQADTCNGHIIDPINVAWYDFSSTRKIAPEVSAELSSNSGFAWSDVSLLEFDPQCVRNLFFQPTNEALDDATGAFASPDRNHVRIFNTYTGTHFFAVGDAHHDHDPLPKLCHGSTDFLVPKRDIYQYFLQSKHFEFWGNTEPIYQGCTREKTASNGYTAVMQTVR